MGRPDSRRRGPATVHVLGPVGETLVAARVQLDRADVENAIVSYQYTDTDSGQTHIYLKQTLNAGDMVPLSLVIEGKDGKRETLLVQAPVRALNEPAPKH